MYRLFYLLFFFLFLNKYTYVFFSPNNFQYLVLSKKEIKLFFSAVLKYEKKGSDGSAKARVPG